MNKFITLILILTLVFTLGCGGNTKTSPTDKFSGITDGLATEEPATISDAISKVEAELGGIDSLDDDFISDELENLDSDLDFEI